MDIGPGPNKVFLHPMTAYQRYTELPIRSTPGAPFYYQRSDSRDPNHSPIDNTVMFQFPIINSTHHLLPSPHGELAPAIHAVLDIFGTEVNVIVAHNGQGPFICLICLFSASWIFFFTAIQRKHRSTENYKVENWDVSCLKPILIRSSSLDTS